MERIMEGGYYESRRGTLREEGARRAPRHWGQRRRGQIMAKQYERSQMRDRGRDGQGIASL